MEESPQEVTRLSDERYSGDEPIDNYDTPTDEIAWEYMLDMDAGESYDYPDWMEDHSDLHTEYGERADW